MPPTAIGMPPPRRSSIFSLSRSPIHRSAELRSTFPAAFATACTNHACSPPVPDHEAGGGSHGNGRAAHASVARHYSHLECRLRADLDGRVRLLFASETPALTGSFNPGVEIRLLIGGRRS